jgi:WD40 repeat protein
LGHTAAVRSVAFSPDGRTLATGSDDRMIKLWDVATRRLRKTLTNVGDGADQILFSPDNAAVTALAGDGWSRSRLALVKTWDARTGRRRGLRSWPAAGGLVVTGAFSPDGRSAALAVNDRSVRVIDVATGGAARLPISEVADALAFSPDGKRLATGGAENAVRIWDAASGRLLVQIVMLPPDPETFAPQWIASTPEGYYECSPQAEQHIRWRLGDRLYGAARYRAEYRRPERLRAVLGAEASP